MTTKQDKQPNTRSFQRGDRIIYNGQFIGTLLSASGHVDGLHWKVQWEDGAETDNVYPASDMVFANGGPDSGQHLLAENQRLRKQLTDVRDIVAHRASELNATSKRMLEESIKLKAERAPDYNYETTMRYAHYAAQAQVTANLVNRALEGTPL